MARYLASDVNSKIVYLKLINKTRGELTSLVKKLDRLLNSKSDCFNYLSARKGEILKKYDINLDDYIIEFVKQEYNEEEALQDKAFKLLRQKNLEEDRQDIINLAKWCSILKNEKDINKRLIVCKTIYNLSYRDFQEYLYNYYCKVHEVLLNGKAYKLGNGIGTIYFKLIDVSNSKTSRIDFQKTKANKEKLLAEGKIPYRWEDAKDAEAQGYKYEGVPYVVFKNKGKEIVLEFKNSKYFTSRRKIEFRKTKYINLKYRGMSYKEIADTFCNNLDDVYGLQVDVFTKEKLAEIVFPGITQKYIR